MNYLSLRLKGHLKDQNSVKRKKFCHGENRGRRQMTDKELGKKKN